MKTLSIVFCIIASTYSLAQNLNFSDTKFKKLLLTSNATNNIALDKNNNSIKIDINNDGEISLEEANQIKILNVRQDPNFKFKDPTNPYEVNENYYKTHLPENINDLLLFNNVEEIYIYDTESIDIHFKNNDKIRIFKYFFEPPYNFSMRKSVTFENCTAITDFNDVHTYIGANIATNSFSIISCPNITNEELELESFASELKIINTPIKSLTINASGPNSYGLSKLIINSVPTLKNVRIGNRVSNELYLDLNNNINLEDLNFIRNTSENEQRSTLLNFINLENNKNLKKITGLNLKNVDLSSFGLINLEELDIAMQNRNKYYGNSNGYIYYGNTDQVNLIGLPKLKKFIAYNQLFSTIDFSNNPLLEEVDLTNTINNLTSLNLSDFNNIRTIIINSNYKSPNNKNLNNLKLKDLKINNNQSLDKLETNHLSNNLENFEVNNNLNLKSIAFPSTADYDYYNGNNTTYVIKENPKLESLTFSVHQFNSLDLSKNKKLKNIYFYDNKIDIDSLNIRNGSTENVNLELYRNFKINTICVNTRQVESIKNQFPDSNIITNCNNDDELSISDIQKNIISIYPNPVLDNLTIKSPQEIKFIEIYSISGEKVLTKIVNSKNYNVNLSHLKSGNYVLKIETNSSSEIKKIIKK